MFAGILLLENDMHIHRVMRIRCAKSKEHISSQRI